MAKGRVKDSKKPAGIGGWLLFILIIQIIGIVIYTLSFIINLVQSVQIGTLSILLHILNILLGIFYLALIFKKSNYAPKWVIISVWVFFISDIILLGLNGNIFNNWDYWVVDLIEAIILNLYFIKSKRVKNTFY